MHLIIATTSLLCSLNAIATSQMPSNRPPNHATPPPSENIAQVIASGMVPNEATRMTVLGKLRELYGENSVINKIEVGGVSSPPKWTENVEKILNTSIKKIHKGQIQINGTQVRLKGNVATPSIGLHISENIATSLSPTYTIVNSLTASDSRQETLDKALSNRVVEFESGSANLTSTGQAILDDMAAAIKQINMPSVELIGHTDNAGNRQANLGLSLARANTVRTYLIGKGIPAESLSTVGAGPDNPIRSNDTAQGRAQNRRIEFRFRE